MNETKSNGKEKIPTANNAGNGCHPAATDGANTAMTLAGRPHTGNGGNGHDVTFTNTKRDTDHNARCQFCGEMYHAQRPSKSKYCSAKCRRNAWLERNPEKAAELAECDRQRLRAHYEARGKTWEQRS